MFNHPYIAIKVDSELDKNTMVKWYDTVRKLGPENICAATEIKPDNRQVRFYMRLNNEKPVYVIPLARHLTMDEVQKISDGWNVAFPHGDFEMLWSQNPQLDIRHQEVKEDVLKTIILEAAKRNHNTWLNEKVSEGWRFGTKLDTLKKISPMCAPWENLSNKYKLTEYRRMVGLIDVLNEMGLKISR